MDSRRTALKKLLAGSSLALTAPKLIAQDDFHFHNPTFPLGVASGDPSHNSLILWTAVNPSQFQDHSPLELEVATDPEFTDLVISTVIEPHSSAFGPERDYTAALEVIGLDPYSTYYYRFRYQGTTSRIGRGKTLPAPDQAPPQLSYAFISCQDYSTGYFNAFSHMADNDQLDFIVHLGDFIYEYDSYPGFNRQHKRRIGLKDNRHVALDLEDFRKIYKTYRQDPHLQYAFSRHTFIITPDDHEIADNAYYNHSLHSPGVGYNSAAPHPYALTPDEQEYLKDNPPTQAIRHKLEQAKTHRRSAIQAWYEYVPTKLNPDQESRHRNFRVGSKLELFATDSRSFRSPQPCQKNDLSRLKCQEHKQPRDQHFMLGSEQTKWLVEGIRDSDATWQVWANQTLLAQLANTSPITGKPLFYFNYDAWDGYQNERDFILEEIAAMQEDSHTGHLIVLTGDMHSLIGSEIRSHYHRKNPGQLIGFEFMTPSISSPNLKDTVKVGKDKDSLASRLLRSQVRKNNPHIKLFKSDFYGYCVMTHTQDKAGQDLAIWDVYYIDKHLEQKPTPGSVEASPTKSMRFIYDPMSKSLQQESMDRH